MYTTEVGIVSKVVCSPGSSGTGQSWGLGITNFSFGSILLNKNFTCGSG